MDNTAAINPDRRRPPRPTAVAPGAMIVLAVALGLSAGYLDVGILIFKKYCWNSEGYFRTASDFPWTVPLGHAFLMLVPGVMVATLGRRWPRLITVRTTSWLFATLAIWMALLRMPLYPASSLLLAAGLGRAIAGAVVDHELLRPLLRRLIFGALVGVLGVLAALSSGWQAVHEYRSVAALPAPPPNPRNVVLIVWDTVRAYNLSLYGYARNTTPNLAHWASKGVKYDVAVSPAPWTYPSHSSFFTGEWPFQLNSQWKYHLDTPKPTLAEYLSTRGYQTAAFVANTNCCSYESGLNRGFAHFADYPLSPRAILTRTVPGKWILERLLSLGAFSFYEKKWATLQSRGGGEITDDFLHWLGRRRPDRPFFAFLNYFDAHEPYIPPPDFARLFGVPPQTTRDFQFLVDYVGVASNDTPDRDLVMARDCYDDCIAAIDAQLGRMLAALEAQGLLKNTDVIITSDHGEAFGFHGGLGHSFSVTLEETGVPLVILSPEAPAGRVVKHPVTLRDLPATVVDLLGISDASPFAGRSLAAHWKQPPSNDPPRDLTSPAFSERAAEIVFHSQAGDDRTPDAVEMSVAALGYHYIRNVRGVEQLYGLGTDPYEQKNLIELAPDHTTVARFRKLLLDVLTGRPGSPEVEKAYLTSYRSRLEKLVSEEPSQSLAAGDPVKSARQ
jgi:arylsulfatase A-like enzyme